MYLKNKQNLKRKSDREILEWTLHFDTDTEGV